MEFCIPEVCSATSLGHVILCYFTPVFDTKIIIILTPGFGLACHLGVLTGTPCIGVGKKLFHVDGLEKGLAHKEQVHSPQDIKSH